MANIAGAKKGDTIAFGHTHLPWHREVEGVNFISTGTVGRPKNGDPRAECVVLEAAAENTTVEFIRGVYDVDLAARVIKASSLPDQFAAHLGTGVTAR